MASLLARLNVDHFVFDLEQPLKAVPVIEGYSIQSLSEKTLDVAVPKQYGLNRLFTELNNLNIKVLSLKNKTNRLEQLFMDLIDTKTAGDQ
jgi:ABC-2 type transport system ATP-binding protein